MPKAFLSHSSKDKGIVTRVASALNAANIHFDELTFDAGQTSASQIINALEKTDLFVLFASKNTVESEWVKSEVKFAQSGHLSGAISRILVFIIDDVSTESIPAWLRYFVYKRSNRPSVLAEMIRSRLIELSLEDGEHFEYFVGREEALSRVKRALSRPTSDSPICIHVSGWEGIGRRSLVRKAVVETYPWISRESLDFFLGEDNAQAELYRALVRSEEEVTLGQLTRRLSEFEGLTIDERTNVLITELQNVVSPKRIVYLRSRRSLQQDNGDFQPWLAQLIQRLPKRNYPFLMLISDRMVPLGKRLQYKTVYFEHLVSLDEEKSQDLLSQLLKGQDIDVDLATLKDLTSYTSGHPRNIQLAAEFIRQFGVGRIQLDKISFRELLSERAAAMLNSFKFTDNQSKIIAIFGDYPIIAVEDLVGLFTDADATFTSDVVYLEERAVLEWESKRYLRLAPYLTDAVSRQSWTKEVEQFRKDSTSKFLARVQHLETNDFVKLTTIDAAALASIRTGVGPKWLSALCLPSHYLHIAKESYDEGRHQFAAQLCEKALTNSQNLTADAVAEALRLRAMSLARLGRDEEFDQCLADLYKFTSRSARRNRHFVTGFRFRLLGLVDKAESEFRKAYSLDGKNFHVLRELSQVLLGQDRFQEAEAFARQAHRIAPTNIFVIDGLLAVLIGTMKNKDESSYGDEIDELFQDMESVAHYKPGMYESRLAEFKLKSGNAQEAIALADQAVSLAPRVFGVYVSRAYICIRTGDSQKFEENLRRMEDIGKDRTTGEGKSRLFMFEVLKCRMYIARGQFSSAKDEIYRRPSMPKNVRNQLINELKSAVIDFGTTDATLLGWVNKMP